MRPYFVVNPASANGKTGRQWPELLALAKGEFGDRLAFGFTERPMHAATLAAKAAAQGHDTIVAVGGDGTLNEVINGVFGDNASKFPAVGVSLLPQGTGGDFARTMGIAGLPAKGVLRQLASGRRRALDVGKLTYSAIGGGRGVRFFVNECSMGLSGRVAREVNQTTKVFGGRASFFWGALKSLARYTDVPLRIARDGDSWENVNVTTLTLANGRFFGGGIQVAPDADPFDGAFSATLWSGYGLWDLLRYQPQMYNGGHVRLSRTRVFGCQSLRAEAVKEGEQVFLDCDGEQPGILPCEVQLLRAALPWVG
ncbi:MAG: diacylglycerol/lipid kinase family protein [Myxococcaceae bacterium]